MTGMALIQDLLDPFHFLRPLWLLALLPVIALGILLWRRQRRASQWQQVIQPELLRHLLEGSPGKASRRQLAGLIAGWVTACIALAGPTWERLPQPVHQSDAAVVILLDMSPSMVAEDIKPSRLERARFKLRDYLSAREEGQTALIAYAGEAHVVSPLTDDTQTIANLLPALHPAIMPLGGSNVEMALEKGLRLLADAGIDQGEILLVTDGVAAEALPVLREKLANTHSHLSILGVGTPEGAPIPTGDGGFARGPGNNIVIAKLNQHQLQPLSHDLGGAYASLSADDSDIQHLLAHTGRRARLDQHQRLVERHFDIWRDHGQWLALLLLPLAALAFRRGWLLTVSLATTLGLGLALPNTSHAFEWRDLWLRSDQQGVIELEQGNPGAAAQQFQSHDWRGTAHYRDDNYSAAANAFAQGETATDHYNRGNALAKAGQLAEALQAYEQALAQQPGFADAEFNADIIRRLLEQQQQSNQQQSNQQQQSDQEQASDQQQQQQAGQQQSASNHGQSDRQQNENAQSQQNNDAPSEQQNQQTSQNNTSDSQPQTVDEQAAQALSDRQPDPQSTAQQQANDQTRQEQPQQTEQQQFSEQQPEQQVAAQSSADPTQNTEQQQALEQWLRQVPDDPSGLLRRKFEYEHRKMRQQYRTGDWLPPDNEAHERW